MLKYLIGFLLNLFNPAVSIFAWIDSDSRVSKKAKVFRGTQVFKSKISKYSYVAPGSKIVTASIGKYCSIGHESCIGMGTHTLSNLSTSPIFTEFHNCFGKHWIEDKKSVYPFEPVTIGNDVWIGRNVLVMGGISIGDGAVVGAGAIVTKDVPSFAIVGGVPAKIIRYRFSENIIKELEEIQWWNLPEDVLKSNIHLFQKDDLKIVDLKKLILEKFSC